MRVCAPNWPCYKSVICNRGIYHGRGQVRLGVDFVAADMPDANRLTIHIIAAVAEAVGRTISENTKTALAAAKARGVKLGNPNGARALRGKQVGNADAVAKLKADATQRALDLAGIVNTLRSKGVTSVRSLADALNEQGYTRAPW